MPELKYEADLQKNTQDGRTAQSVMDQLQAVDDGPRPLRWKLRLRRKPEDKDTKKKGKKGKKKKQETPPPEEIEEWELGPTIDEMRNGVLEKYFDDVRARANKLLESKDLIGIRKISVPRTREYLKNLLGREYEDVSSMSTLMTEAESKQLPTILEASKENFAFDANHRPLNTVQILLSHAQQNVDVNDGSIKGSTVQNIQEPVMAALKGQSTISTPEPGSTDKLKAQKTYSPTKSLTSASEMICKTPHTIPDDGGNGEADMKDDLDDDEDEKVENLVLYENNQFGQRLTKENVLNYVINKNMSAYKEKSGAVKLEQTVVDQEPVNEEDMLNTLMEEEQEKEDVPQQLELSPDELKAIYECVWVGDIDLLDDLLELPGADINIKQFGENLLMTAIRAGQKEVAAYLINNRINTKEEVARFEKRDDVKMEIEMQKAQENMQDKPKKKKKKKQDKNKDIPDDISYELSTLKGSSYRDEVVKTPEKNNAYLIDMECYMVSCREMALDFAMYDIVDMIDIANGELWGDSIDQKYQPRKRIPLEDKLRGQGLYFEEDDANFMEEPEKQPPPPLEQEITEELKKNKRKNDDIHGRRTTQEQQLLQQLSRITDPTPVAETPFQPELHPIQATPVQLQDRESPLPPPPQMPQRQEEKKPKMFKATRVHLTKKATTPVHLNLFQELSQPEPEPRKLVALHGSYAYESRAWYPVKLTTKPQSSNPLVSRSLGDFEKTYNSNTQDFSYEVRPKSRLRQVTPWKEDDPEYMQALLKRKQMSSAYQLAPNVLARPVLKRENTVLPLLRGASRKGKNPSSALLGAVRYPQRDWLFSRGEPAQSKSRLSRDENERSRPSNDIPVYITRPTYTSHQTKKMSNSYEKPLSGKRRADHQSLHNGAQYLNQVQNGPARPSTKRLSPGECTPSKRGSPAGYLKASFPSTPSTANHYIDNIRDSLDKFPRGLNEKKVTRFAVTY